MKILLPKLLKIAAAPLCLAFIYIDRKKNVPVAAAKAFLYLKYKFWLIFLKTL